MRTSLIIGLLSGESDYRRVELLTPEGSFPIYGHGTARPFEIVESSPTRIVVRLRMREPGGEFPDRLDYRFLPNERSLLTAIILDEVDFARVDGSAVADEIFRHNRHYRVQPLPPPAYTIVLVAYSFSHPILRLASVRQALAYSINREEIYTRNFSLSGADMLRGPFDEHGENYAPGLREFDYDPKRAIALLRNNGWRDTDGDGVLDRDGQPLRFRLLFQEGLQVEEQIIREMKIDWLRLGIDAQPIAVPAAMLNDKLRIGDFDAVLLKQRFDETPESLEAFFGDGTGTGQFRYANANFHHTLESCKRLKDPVARRPSLQRLQLILNEDQAANFLYSQWNTYYIFNHAKFDNYLDTKTGQPRSFLEWRLRRPSR